MPLPTCSVPLPVPEHPFSASSFAHQWGGSRRPTERNLWRLSGMGKPFILFRHHPLRPLRPLCPRISRGWTRNVHAKRPAYVRDRGLSVSLIRQSPGHGRDLSGVANHPGPRSVRASNVSAHSPRRVRSTGRRLSSASLLSVRAMSGQPFALRPEKQPAKHPVNVHAIARAYVPETSRQCPDNHVAQSAKQVASRTRIIRGASGWQVTQRPTERPWNRPRH